jgi:fibronectin-binding autotransporter adhesin
MAGMLLASLVWLVAPSSTCAQIPLFWTGGDLLTSLGASTLPIGLTLNITTNADHFFVGTSLINNGTTNWQDAGSLRSWSGGRFTNNGTFNDLNSTTASVYTDYDGNFVSTNNGIYVKSGSGTTIYSVNLDNHGTMTVSAGTLLLQGGGTNSATGTIFTASGATTQFAASYSLADGSVTSGPGSYLLTGGTLDIAGTVTLSSLAFTGGALANTQTFAATTLTWSGTFLGNGGVTSIAPNSTFNLVTATDHRFENRTIVNNGTTNWQDAGSLRSWAGGRFTNYGTFNDLNATTANIYTDYDGNFVFTNHGTYLKSGSGITNLSIPFANNGTIVASAGLLHFTSAFSQGAVGSVAVANNATTQVDAGLTFTAGTLSGTGTIISNVTSAGTVSPGTSLGTLTISGNLTLSSTAETVVELGGTISGVSYDLISVTGTVSLDGTLKLSFINGFATTITASDTFTVLTAPTLSGVFVNVASGSTLGTLGGEGAFSVFYGVGSPFSANSVVLTNFTPVPEPSTWALLLLGLAALGLIARRKSV